MKLVARIRAGVDRASHHMQWLPPLLARVVLGVTFTLTGWGKLHNLEQVTRFFDSLGIPAVSVQAPLVAVVEFVGGILVLVGLGTRIAALLLSAVMAVAIATAIWPKQNLTETLGSIEAIYLAGLVYLTIGGAGALSVDQLATRFVPALRGAPSAKI